MTSPLDEHRIKSGPDDDLDDTKRVIMETKKLLKEVADNQDRLSVQLDLLDQVITEKYRGQRHGC